MSLYIERIQKAAAKKKAAEKRINKALVEERFDEVLGVKIKVLAPQSTLKNKRNKPYTSIKEKDAARRARMQSKEDRPRDAYELACNYGVEQKPATDFDVKMNMVHNPRFARKRVS